MIVASSKIDTFTPIGDIAMTVFSKTASIVKKSGQEILWSGEKIAVNGIYSNIPIDRYHNDTKLFDGFSISSSGLRQVIRRPSEYWCYSPYNPNRYERESTKALDFGQAAHMLILGEEGFASQYVLRPDVIDGAAWQGNRKVCKEWMNDAKESGRTVITEKEIEDIRHIADNLVKHPIVQQGVLNGRVERSIVYRDGNIWIKSRPDLIVKAGGDFVDLKTAVDVSNEALMRTIYEHGYHVQAAVVRMAIREVMGEGIFNSFSFVFVEKKPPYDVRVMQLRPEDIDVGERQARLAIQKVKHCLEVDEWPGYDGFNPSVDWIFMPVWARTNLENSLEKEERAA